MNRNVFWNSIAIGLFIIFALILFNNEYEMRNHHKTCARFVETFRAKSTVYYVFQYKVDNKLLRSARGGDSVKIKDCKKLESFDCIEIIYSTSDPRNIRITDKRVGKEWINWE